MDIDTLINAASPTFAAVCIFEGVRRLAKAGASGSAVAMLILGTVYYGAHATISWYAHKNVAAIVFPKRPLVVPELPETWGADFSREVRVRNSLQLAQAAFWEHGRLQKHFVDPGTWILFVPTQEDVRKYAERVEMNAKAEMLEQQTEWLPTKWGLIALMAAIFGYLFSRVPESANKALQGDVPRPAGSGRA